MKPGPKSEPWSLKKRAGYWYVKFRGESGYHTTNIEIANERVTRKLAEAYANKRSSIVPAALGYNTFGEYSLRYFKPGSCPWFARQRSRGNMVQEHYRDAHRGRLEIHILPQFGRVQLRELSPVAMEDWLYSLAYSSQTKKHIYETLMVILRDLRRDRLLEFDLSDLQPPVVRHQETRAPTETEAAQLFPADVGAFQSVWGGRYQIGVLCALAYSTGMRSGELRALNWRAIHRESRGLVVVEAINRDNEHGSPKKGSVRAIPVPEWTLSLIDTLPASVGYVFPGRTLSHLEIASIGHALTAICEEQGIEHLTPHGLRHGYNTRMRQILAAAGMEPYFDRVNGFKVSTEATDAVLRHFTGHKTRDMTDLYDHPELLKQLAFFDTHFRAPVDSFWNFRAGGGM